MGSRGRGMGSRGNRERAREGFGIIGSSNGSSAFWGRQGLGRRHQQSYGLWWPALADDREGTKDPVSGVEQEDRGGRMGVGCFVGCLCVHACVCVCVGGKEGGREGGEGGKEGREGRRGGKEGGREGRGEGKEEGRR